MSTEDTHKPIRIYIGVLILGVNTSYMFFCFFKLFAVLGNELMRLRVRHLKGLHDTHHGSIWLTPIGGHMQ